MTQQNPSISKAHSFSLFAVVDPVYRTDELAPDGGWQVNLPPWIYGPTELEAWRHQVLREESERTMGGDCCYPGAFHTAFPQASFRRALAGNVEAPRMKFRAVGRVSVFWKGRLVLQAEATDELHDMELPPDGASGDEIRIELATEAEPPALLIEEGPLQTDSNWQWRAADLPWQAAAPRAQHRSGLPPHRVDEPEIELLPVGRVGELIDFGRELLARPVLTCAGMPSISTGESVTEALNNGSLRSEYKYDLIRTAEGTVENSLPLAFRYLRVLRTEPTRIACRASFHPVRYRGAFACSDERLTRIWMTSAYTLRLCLHDFILDGIKRDRLPWVGDLAMSLSIDAYTFADAEIVRRTLTVLGRAGIAQGDVNGIVDYSFWWVISHDLFQRYFDDPAYLESEWPRIRELLLAVARRCDGEGLIRPAANAWVFIDWVDFDKTTALQIMWFWAQQAGMQLATRMRDADTAALLRESSEKLQTVLLERAWDPIAQAWCANPDQPSPPSRHANFLAVMSGLARPEQSEGILAVLRGDSAAPVGTPYMAGFENAALARLGDAGQALENMAMIWGRMLDLGATSFWEGYDAKKEGDAIYAFYGRPFANSLCHAWSAGPAWLLPAEILGIRPLADGWKKFTVKPRLGPLTFAHACVPTIHGEIQVECDNGGVRIRVPASCILVFSGREYPGPQLITERL
jgi:alpha-L-rhamnosidase